MPELTLAVKKSRIKNWSLAIFTLSLFGFLFLWNISLFSIAAAIIIPVVGLVTAVYCIAKIWPRARYVTPLSFLLLASPLCLFAAINPLTVALSVVGVWLGLVSLRLLFFLSRVIT